MLREAFVIGSSFPIFALTIAYLVSANSSQAALVLPLAFGIANIVALATTTHRIGFFVWGALFGLAVALALKFNRTNTVVSVLFHGTLFATLLYGTNQLFYLL